MAHKICFVRKISVKTRTNVRGKNYAIVLSPNIFELAPFGNILLTLEIIAVIRLFNIYFPNLNSFHQSIFIILYSSENYIDCKLLITKNNDQKQEAKKPNIILILASYKYPFMKYLSGV